jgi:hypothetical protein
MRDWKDPEGEKHRRIRTKTKNNKTSSMNKIDSPSVV